jgi:hypothetical protein
MTSLNREEIITPLNEAAQKLRIAAGKAQAAASLRDGTFDGTL